MSSSKLGTILLYNNVSSITLTGKFTFQKQNLHPGKKNVLYLFHNKVPSLSTPAFEIHVFIRIIL